MKVLLLADSKWDMRVSMDVYAYNLLKEFNKLYSGCNEFSLFRGESECLNGTKYIRNDPFSSYIKRRIARYLLYSIRARGMKSDINHITDHVYGFLLHFLDKRKTIITCHDLIPVIMKKVYGKNALSPIGQRIYKIILRGLFKAKRIITISERTKKDLVTYLNIDEEKIEVIYLGVDDKFRGNVSLGRIEDFKRKFNWRKGRYLLHVGNCSWYKNIPIILKALKELSSSGIGDIYFIKVGEEFSAGQQEMIKRLKLEEKVIHLGSLSDEELIVAYRLADVLINPSFYEGFGLPVIEAFASGTPVVLSKAGALPEIGGPACLVVDPTNAREICEAIGGVFLDEGLRLSLISKGLLRAKTFSWEETAKKTFRVYEEIMSSRIRDNTI